MFAAIALALISVGKSALRAIPWEPGCDAYAREARSAARALDRGKALAARIFADTPKHNRTARIVHQALTTAQDTVDGLIARVEAEELSRAGKATLRAASRVGAIQAPLMGQPEQPLDEKVVLEGTGT